jgi:hypothetical protein
MRRAGEIFDKRMIALFLNALKSCHLATGRDALVDSDGDDGSATLIDASVGSDERAFAAVYSFLYLGFH